MNDVPSAQDKRFDLNHRFNHHPPRDEAQRTAYETVRATIRDAAKTIDPLVPNSPEKTRALNALDEAMFLYNAAIARNS